MGARSRLLAASLAIILLTLVWPAPLAGAPPPFAPADCPSPAPEGVRVQCGYLTVPEDRSRPDERQIRLAVAIVKSRHASPAPDPLIVVHGGPGSGVMGDLGRLAQGDLGSLLRDLDRDLVVFDQRGVGESDPALECPELTPMLLAQLRGAELTVAELQSPYRACRDRWLAQGVDLRAYTTSAVAADLRDLWRSLGYRQVNLYGISYGTVVVQTALRDHPEEIRSVVLDSAYPLEAALLSDLASSARATVGLAFDTCAADWMCQRLYPDSRSAFTALAARLDLAPVRIATRDPVTGEPFSITFRGADLAEIAQRVPPRALPALIADLAAGDYHAVIELRAAQIRLLHEHGPPPGAAMAYAVKCSQGLYAAPAPQPPATDPFDAWADRFIREQLLPLPCTAWPSGVMDDLPATSDIPALVLIGGADPSVAPSYPRQLGESLRGSSIVVVPGVGHGVLDVAGPCGGELVRAYLRDPAHPPDAGCLAHVARPAFDTPYVISGALMRGPATAALGLLAAALAWCLALSVASARRGPRFTIAWAAARRALAWRALLASGAMLLAVWLVSAPEAVLLTRGRVVEVVLPLLVALQAATLFVPEQEPALEITLACPRPLPWLVLERLAGLLAGQGALGLLAGGLIAWTVGEPQLQAVARWLPPLLWLTGAAVFLTLLLRRAALSLGVVALAWFTATWFGDAVVERWPFLWPLHIYLQPGHAGYALNRWLTATAGLVAIALGTAYLLRDPERLFGGAPSRWPRARPRRAGSGPSAASVGALRTAPRMAGQVWAALRYELLLQWRRPVLGAFAGGLLVTPALGALASRERLAPYGRMAEAGLLSTQEASGAITGAMLPFVWVGGLLLLLLFLPFAVAELLAKDHDLGVGELLTSLPLSPAAYLAGKLLGLWAALASCVALVAALSTALWRLLVGPLDYGAIAEVWLLGVGTTALSSATLSALLAAGQPTRRRALAVGGLFVLLSLAGIAAAFVAYAPLWNALNPARPAVGLYFLFGRPGVDLGSGGAADVLRRLATFDDVLWAAAGGAAEVALAWAWVWWRMRRGR